MEIQAKSSLQQGIHSLGSGSVDPQSVTFVNQDTQCQEWAAQHVNLMDSGVHPSASGGVIHLQVCIKSFVIGYCKST